MSRLTRTALALAASAAIVGACGSSGTPAPAATGAPATGAVNVDIKSFAFPANTDVAKGTKVTWSNKDSTAHTVTSGTRPNKDGKFDAGQLAP